MILKAAKCPHCGSEINQRAIADEEVVPGRATLEVHKRNARCCKKCNCIYDADNGTILGFGM